MRVAFFKVRPLQLHTVLHTENISKFFCFKVLALCIPKNIFILCCAILLSLHLRVKYYISLFCLIFNYFILLQLRQTTSGNQASCSMRLLRNQLRCTLLSLFLLQLTFSFRLLLLFLLGPVYTGEKRVRNLFKQHLTSLKSYLCATAIFNCLYIKKLNKINLQVVGWGVYEEIYNIYRRREMMVLSLASVIICFQLFLVMLHWLCIKIQLNINQIGLSLTN